MYVFIVYILICLYVYISIGLLVWRLDYSQIGGALLYVFSSFFFSSAILDAHSLDIGTEVCNQDFYGNTSLILTNGISCATGAFVFTVLLGLWCAFQCYLTAMIVRKFHVTRTVVHSSNTTTSTSNLETSGADKF